MSFDQLSSLEAGTGGAPRRAAGSYSDDPGFTRLAQDLENLLFKLTTNMSDLRAEMRRKDNPRVRERIHNLLEETRDMFKSAGEDVKKIQMWDDVTPTQKYKQQKLSRELKSSLAEFQSLQQKALEKQKASVSAARAAMDQEESGAHPASTEEGQLQLLQQQELVRLAPQDEVDFQDALIQEREEEIRAIEQGVGDLNVLFQQVAQIVTEQGEQLNTIVDTAEDVRDDTRGADYELRAAARYQKNARSKACWLLLILATIFTIIILAVFLG